MNSISEAAKNFGMIKNITKLILWTDRRNTFYERIHS